MIKKTLKKFQEKNTKFFPESTKSFWRGGVMGSRGGEGGGGVVMGVWGAGA